ncbi:uncharacterized protein F5891DRAFT_1041005 [Suillus fuscotomentosus]|uniref:Uncharacterized protein n=1 Tax=Suillus fuscotomentosus TaxID=1912939 RepID=A0AAD4E3Q8_9AGAM|nr:uncharacterized protein F5891DRAFT_1041005 [Suillus fuscotomentosus]KAG1899000.1 hypothetical protein F5891DRAFT_1041005 [Suillus fuscotomentosus]
MDAQRFDPLRRTNMRLASLFKTRTSDSTPMRQGPCVKSEKTSASDVRPDHEIVIDPVEGKDSDLKGSCPPSKDTCTTRVTTPVDIHDSVDKVATHTITRSEPNPRGGAPIVSVTEIVYRRPPSHTDTSSPSQSSSSVSPQSIPPPGFNDSAETVATGTIIQSDPNPRGGAPIVSRAQMMSRGVWSHSPCRTQMVFTGVVSRSLPTNASSPSQSPSPSASSRSTPPLTNESVDVLTTRTVTCPDPSGGAPTVSREQMVFRGVLSRSPSCSQMVFTGTVSCPPARTNTSSPARTNTPSPSQSSSPSASSQSTPPPGFIRRVFRALDRFNTSSASGSDADDLKVHKRKRHVLLAIVKERRGKHKDDRVFKDIAGNDFPAAGVRDST